MAAVQCPHCGTQLDAPNALAGGNARCRSCGGRFVLPGLIAVPPSVILPPEPPPVQQQPLVVIHGSGVARERARLESTGWFTRSFMTTLGVLVALLFIPLTIAAIVVLAAFVLAAINSATY